MITRPVTAPAVAVVHARQTPQHAGASSLNWSTYVAARYHQRRRRSSTRPRVPACDASCVFARGPVRGSFWIEPGRLLAGPYPRELDALRNVDVFLDLTGEDEGLEAYAAELGARARAVRRPIPDFGIPSVEEMAETLDVLERELAGGNVVYLHCHYGIGRTGTTLAAYLLRRGVRLDDALHSLRAIGKGPEAPQQVAFLRRFADTAAGTARG